MIASAQNPRRCTTSRRPATKVLVDLLRQVGCRSLTQSSTSLQGNRVLVPRAGPSLVSLSDAT
eukprot:6624243-Prorocentrum_lima.AAC.1